MTNAKRLHLLVFLFLFVSLVAGSSVAMSPLTPNSPPSFSQLGNQEGSEGETLEFLVTVTDADEEIVELSAEFLPEGADFMDNGDNTGTFTWTPEYDQAGEYSVTFVATDSSDVDEKVTITITVENTNRAPSLLAPADQQIEATQELSFRLVASDPDQDPLVIVVQGLPMQAQFDADTLLFEWTPSTQNVGTHTLTFQVSDGQLSDSEEVVITVTAPPQNNQSNNTGSQNNTSNPTSPEEQELQDLQDEFDVLEDDFSSYKRSYERALDRDDEEDIEEYEEKLEDLDEELEDLLPEVEELLDDIDDNDDLDNQNALEEDAEDLYDDIQELRHDIDVLLHGEEEEEEMEYEETTGTSSAPPAVERGTRVLVEPINIPPTAVPTLPEEKSDSQWEEVRPLVWIGAGITVVVAIIIFLLALLLL